MNLLHPIRRLVAFRRNRRDEAGYSLIEILVVLAIMAVLATLVAPRLLGQVDRSKLTAARAQISALKTGLDTLRLDIGRYPEQSEGLSLLVNPPAESGLESLWFGPYIEGDLPVDPWGNPYEYVPPASGEAGRPQGPVILSYGADGEPGGEGIDADISSPVASTASS